MPLCKRGCSRRLLDSDQQLVVPFSTVPSTGMRSPGFIDHNVSDNKRIDALFNHRAVPPHPCRVRAQLCQPADGLSRAVRGERFQRAAERKEEEQESALFPFADDRRARRPRRSSGSRYSDCPAAHRPSASLDAGIAPCRIGDERQQSRTAQGGSRPLRSSRPTSRRVELPA